MSRPACVLVVEDDPAIQELLRYALVQANFEVSVAGNAELGLEEIRRELPAVVLLDLMLPGMSGISLARHLRADPRTRTLPIIMVTAKAEETDRIQGLDLGADDYVTKPFSPKELVSRIRAVLRRRAPHLAGETIEIGAIRLDPLAHEVNVCGASVNLGPTEFDLLLYFMNNPDRAFTRDQLLNVLRGDHRYLADRTIDVYVRRLRAGLGPVGDAMIETIRGTGYKLKSRPS
jgi:two-component system phosphate regulon response regulator PhoB